MSNDWNDYALIIRKAKKEDAAAIYDVLQASFVKYAEDAKLSVDIEALKESVDKIAADICHQEVLIAVLNGTAVGTLRVQLQNAKDAYLTRFGVLPEYRHVGIGQTMMNVIVGRMRSQGIERILLHTASKNADLMRFYYNRGFYVYSTSTERGYVRALMVKDLHDGPVTHTLSPVE